jgi:hypothetical protein
MLDRLEDERSREAALTDRLEDVVTELEGPGLDEAILARLSEEHATVAREALGGVEEDMGVDGFFDDLTGIEEDPWDPVAESEAEIERLLREIEGCRARQEGIQAYLDALGDETAAE